MNKLLKRLTEAVGVSGFENEVRILIRDQIQDYADDIQIDALGNLLVTKNGTGDSSLRVMIDAHMDEVGLMITEIDRNGTFKFATVGGIDDRSLLGKVVQIGSKKITGVIGARPIHLLKRGQHNRVVKLESMRIDIGAKNKDNATSKVKPGDLATFVTGYLEVGDVAIGKAFDNRTGCAALIELLEKDRYPFDLVAAFTVQEEVGLRGAQVAAYAVKPDLALVLECTPAYDLPNNRDVSPNVSLGSGPSIYVMDSYTIQDPRLVSHITHSADTEGIPFQLRRPGGGGTNTGAIQRATVGTPAATIATPCRYPHNPVSMINLSDFANVIKLTDASLRSLTADILTTNS
jgi:endoglucanase